MTFSMDDLLEMVIESSMEYEDMIIEEVEDDEFLESEADEYEDMLRKDREDAAFKKSKAGKKDARKQYVKDRIAEFNAEKSGGGIKGIAKGVTKPATKVFADMDNKISKEGSRKLAHKFTTSADKVAAKEGRPVNNMDYENYRSKVDSKYKVIRVGVVGAEFVIGSTIFMGPLDTAFKAATISNTEAGAKAIESLKENYSAIKESINQFKVAAAPTWTASMIVKANSINKKSESFIKECNRVSSTRPATESSIDDVFAFQTYVREEAGIPVNKEKIDKLEEQIQALDEKYEQAKKKLVEGFYTDDQFDVMTKAHEREVKKLRDKINALK